MGDRSKRRGATFTVAEANATVPGVQDAMSRIILLRSQAGMLHADLAEAGFPVQVEDDEQLTLLVEDEILEGDEDDLSPPEWVLRDAGKLRALYAAISDVVAEIEKIGAVIEDVEDGLVEWRASYGGREVWLSWRFGEHQVNVWHEFRGGVGDPHPVAELETLAPDER